MLWSSSGDKDLKMLIQIYHLSLLKLDGIQYGVFLGAHMSVKLIELMFILLPVESIISVGTCDTGRGQTLASFKEEAACFSVFVLQIVPGF